MKTTLRTALVATALAIVTISLLALGGCSRTERRTLSLYNWGDYIDETIISDFEKETGIRVRLETYATNEDMYAKLQQGGSSYDILIPSDYMVHRLILEQRLQKLDFSKLSNYANIDPAFQSQEFDPQDEYSVPYFWGTIGIAYNTTMVEGPVDSWNILWDERYAGQIVLMDSIRDVMAMALKRLGHSLNSTNPAEIDAAKQSLIEQKPLILAYMSDINARDVMIAEEAALAMIFSGEAGSMRDENPAIAYVLPREGTNVWIDSMVIPADAKNVAEAHEFINFMLRPEIAARNTEYIWYATPNRAALELLDEEMRDDPILYPDPEDLARAEVFRFLGPDLELYNQAWTEIKVQ